MYQFYFNDAIIGNRSSGLLNITVDADGVYTCVPIFENDDSRFLFVVRHISQPQPSKQASQE